MPQSIGALPALYTFLFAFLPSHLSVGQDRFFLIQNYFFSNAFMWGNIFERGRGCSKKKKTYPSAPPRVGSSARKSQQAHGLRLYLPSTKRRVTLGYECPGVVNWGGDDDDKILMSFLLLWRWFSLHPSEGGRVSERAHPWGQPSELGIS
jgi:hypothetical protein